MEIALENFLDVGEVEVVTEMVELERSEAWDWPYPRVSAPWTARLSGEGKEQVV